MSSWSVVVLNWNLAPDTVDCIRSMERAGFLPHQIVLVDNGSTDDSLEHFFRVLDPAIKLLSLSENLGFAGGVNHGIRAALADGAEWVLLINNDTFVDLAFLQELKRAVFEQPTWRIISPLILYADEPNRIWSMGDQCIGATTLTRGLLRNQLVPSCLPAYIEVDSLNACGMLVHRDVFTQIGFLDERYFMYAEDVDFCWRARQAGFQLGVTTRARMWHKVSRSTGVHHPQSSYWRIYNQILFYRRREQFKYLPVLFLFTLMRVVFLAAKNAVKGRLAVTKSTLRGWFDGWFLKEPLEL